MPIALTCTCGRSLRVKDEVAGKKIRCPACSTVLAVPQPEAPADAEEMASNLLLEDDADDAAPDNHDTAEDAPATDAIQPPPRPGPRPPPPEPPPPQWKWRKKKEPLSVPLRKPKAKSGGGLFNNVNPNYGVMWSGVFMMIGGIALGLLFGGCLLAGIIWPYLLAIAAVLFFGGLGTIFKGLMGRND